MSFFHYKHRAKTNTQCIILNPYYIQCIMGLDLSKPENVLASLTIVPKLTFY